MSRRNLETFNYQLKLSFLRKSNKNDNKDEFLDFYEFTLNMIFKILHKNYHYRNRHIRGNREKMKVLNFLVIQPNHESVFLIQITKRAFPLLKALGSSLEKWLMQTLPSLPEGIQRLLIRSHLRWWTSR